MEKRCSMCEEQYSENCSHCMGREYFTPNAVAYREILVKIVNVIETNEIDNKELTDMVTESKEYI
jgi:hypothetical protein